MSAPADRNQEDPLPPPDPVASTLSTRLRPAGEDRRTLPAALDDAADTVPQAAPPPGTRPQLPSLTGYEVIRELGRGGMGIVFLARQSYVNRLVALKVILLGQHAQATDRLRFLAEAEAVARLRHPNIVQLYEFGEHDGYPYFTLEYVAGGSLAAQLREAPLTPHEAAAVVESLARGVHHAHQQGIIHRDLKPANVLLANLVPKIADFGLAKRLEANSGLTHTGAIVGTPSYMAPEQARGEGKEAGPLADVWALGAILYECLTARPPFKGATVPETLHQVLHEEPVPPTRFQRTVPRDLETICLRCLQKDPARRYSSAEALADDLRRFLEGRPILARPVGMLERGWRWCRRNRLIASLLAALALAILGGFVGVTWKWLDAERQRERAGEAERRATARAEEARRSAEDLETALASLSETFTDLGRVQTRWGDLDAAIRAFQRACFLVEERVRETRSVPLQAALVQGYTFLGVLRQKNKQPDLAAEAYGKAARLVAKLSAGPPDEIANRADYGQTCYALAVALREFQRPPAERLVAAQQGVFHLSMVLRKNPANKELRTATSVAYFELGDVQRKLGQLAASASTALERQKLWPDNPDQVYDVACELARCMAAVGQGKARLTPAEQAERRRYGDLAMLVLEQAVKMGLKDVAAAAHDDDLAPLRDRDDFRKLISGQKR